MEANVQRWGNSLAVRIPKAFALETGLSQGMRIEIAVSGRSVTITPVPAGDEKLTLDQLLEGMTEDMVHPEIDWGPPVGHERVEW
ncbi:MAG: AbrB/MazE/SpoVT family DNA-binding domain-containing protein [Dehalococcoidia bacterium]